MEKGKVVLVTGAGDGIGRAIALELGNKEDIIILLSKSEENLKTVSSKIKDSRYFICDITNNERIKDIITKIETVYGRIDVLVNCAGIWIEGEVDKNNSDDIKRVVEVNFTAQTYMTKAVLPIMKRQKSGLIINVISQAGFYAKAERSVYNATKFALAGFTKSLQPELAKYGIKVTGLYPGKVNTKLFSKVNVEKKMNDAITPEDVAQAVAFVVSRPGRVSIPEIGIKDIEG